MALVEIGYVGNKGTDLDTSATTANNPLPGAGVIQARRPYQGFGNIRLWDSDGNSTYHALQGRFEHRFSHGFSLTTSYAWSHMIDDEQGSLNGSRALWQDPNHREKANSENDLRHVFSTGYVWDLPFGRKLKHGVGNVLGGWSLSGIVTLRSGGPLNISQSSDGQNNGGGSSERPDLVSGQNPVLPAKDPSHWFNTSAFTTSLLHYGSSPRDPEGMYGPGLKTWDFSTSKIFKLPIGERHQLMFRGEFFNVLNKPQFGNPGSSLGTGTFGVVTGTSVNNREIQLALKYSF